MEQVLLSVLLIEYRKSKGLAQHEMAPKFGVSQQALGKLEAGVSLPRKGTMLKIAQETGYAMHVLQAAKVAQYQRNQQEQTGAAPSQADVCRPGQGAVGVSGIALLAKLSGALARDKLKPHQVAALATLVDSFTHDVAPCA